MTGRRQFDPETTAMHTVGLDTHLASHFFGSFADDGQTDACAFIPWILVNPFKHTEKARLEFWFDANSIISNPKSDQAIISFSPQFNLWVNPLGDELGAIN